MWSVAYVSEIDALPEIRSQCSQREREARYDQISRREYERAAMDTTDD